MGGHQSAIMLNPWVWVVEFEKTDQVMGWI